jgi:hypothetical protein
VAATAAAYDAHTGQRIEHALAPVHARVDALADELRAARQEVQALTAHVQHANATIEAIHNSRSWRVTAPLREANAVLRPLIGRGVRFAVRAGKAVARRVPVVKAAARWALQTFPAFERQVTRFSPPRPPGVVMGEPPIRDFEQLRSARIMLALAQADTHAADGPVTFLQVSDHAR